jgi:hypothetical protein
MLSYSMSEKSKYYILNTMYFPHTPTHRFRSLEKRYTLLHNTTAGFRP